MTTKFHPWEWVVIKSAEEIIDMNSKAHIFWWWNKNMYSLCWKSFRITDVTVAEDGQILKWLDTCWTISSDMVKHVAPVDFDNATKPATVPRFATPSGPEYSDLFTDGAPMRDLREAVRSITPVSYAKSVPQGKRSRIQFSKIR